MSRATVPERASPARLVREVAPFVVLACACGAATQVTRPSAASTEAPPATSASAAVASEGFDDLVALASSVAPGMRELARRSGDGAIDLVSADAGDTCVRIAFASGATVVARLVDGRGETVAVTTAAGDHGVLPAGGPLCIRKGESLHAQTEPAAHVRWLIWSAP